MSSSSKDDYENLFSRLNVPYTIFEVLVSIVTVIGNTLVLVAFKRERKLRRRTNYYIVSLAVADLLVGLIGIPCAILASVGLPQQLQACLFSVSLLVVLCTISIFSLVAVSLDRYWAILHPMSYSRNVNSKFALGIICLCWILGGVVGFLPLFGWNVGFSGPPECLFTKVMDYNYLVFLYFTTIVGPALLLAAFYSHIYNIILKQLRQMVSMNETGSMTNGFNTRTTVHILADARRKEVKATQNLSIIVLFFIICWMPLYTINCIQAFCENCGVPDLIINMCIILSHLNSAGNPLLYAYRLSDFRAAFRSMFFGAFTSSTEQMFIGGRTSDYERTPPKSQPMISISFNPRKYKFSKDSRKLFKFEKKSNADKTLMRTNPTTDDNSMNSSANERYANVNDPSLYDNHKVEGIDESYAYLNSMYLDVENLNGFSKYNAKRKRIHSALDDTSYVLMLNDEANSQDETTKEIRFSISDYFVNSESNKRILQRRHSMNT